MPYVVNTKELKSIYSNPHGHLIRIVSRVILIVLFLFLYFKTETHVAFHIALCLLFAITFIESKRQITIDIKISMYDDRVNYSAIE